MFFGVFLSYFSKIAQKGLYYLKYETEQDFFPMYLRIL